MPDMDRLQSMRVFEAVVDQGSFAAAARSLDLSPAVVTRAMADLEEYLGTRLLHRSTRRLSLTDAGDVYLQRVRAILRDIDDAHAIASSHTQELAGVLRVQAPPSLASYVLAPALRGFRERYPKISVDLDVWAPKEPPIEDYDLTLLGVDDGYDADVIARKALQSQSILFASPAYLARHGTPQSPGDLGQHECLRIKVFGERPGGWRMWCEQDAAKSVEVDIEPVLWANHNDTLLRAALDGAGIASAPVDLVVPYLASGELVRVLPPWITGRLAMYVAVPSRKFVPLRTRVFIDYLIEHAQHNARVLRDSCAGCAGDGLLTFPDSLALDTELP